MKNPINPHRGYKSVVVLITFTLLLGGFGAQATGFLNTSDGGYLICVDSKTRSITHPVSRKCATGSKKIVLGARGETGATGLTGAAGLDGQNGLDGKTLWNGVKDPDSFLGSPGDMFINSVTKTLFGPKDPYLGWPSGVSLVGPTGSSGPQGPQGPVGPGGAAGVSGSSAPIASDSNCINTKCTYKIGETGPGGGLIFFVDYNNQYPALDYMEAAPASCEAKLTWSSNAGNKGLVVGASGADGLGVGKGRGNTTAILDAASSAVIIDAPGALFADSLESNVPIGCEVSKSDWFMGSLGEMKLLRENLLGARSFREIYWTSSMHSATYAWYISLSSYYYQENQTWEAGYVWVLPIRSF